MLSRETLEAYRRMTTSQRLEVTLEMIHENMAYLFTGHRTSYRGGLNAFSRKTTISIDVC